VTNDSELLAGQIAEIVVQIYEIHDIIIAQTGGLPGLRDGAMLHSAIARPFATFAGEELYPSDFEKAAALFHSLIKSHPFMDGAKRTAFTAALYFLENQGHSIPLELPKAEIIRFCIGIAEENMHRSEGEMLALKTIAEIADWLRQLVNINE
jgi:death-on-curing protein